MNRSVIFDIRLGASGDMLLGSLIDLGLDVNALRRELEKLGLDGWDMSPVREVKYGICGTSARISCTEGPVHRTLSDITGIIEKSPLPESIRNKSIAVFTRLAKAEAGVHGLSADKVHFHEVGAVDSIIDITGFCAALDLLGVEKFYFNEFCFGSGTVQSQHGELPLPAPAVVQLTRNYTAVWSGRDGEQTTPTAAAILTALGKQMRAPMSFTLLQSGTGFGTRSYTYPSYTRAMLAETEPRAESDIVLLECNVDDMNPQIYPHVIELLFQRGALDAYLTPVIMKKGRPGTLITVIAPNESLDRIKDLIYRETTTLGTRVSPVVREKLERGFSTVRVFDEEVRIKTGYLNGEPVNIQPEYEDCKRISELKNIPLKEIINEAARKSGKKPVYNALNSSDEKI